MINRCLAASLAAMLLLPILLPDKGCARKKVGENHQQEKTMTLLPAIEKTTSDTPDAAVIWLHGLGADGNDFAPIVEELRLPEEIGIRFIFPHAPSIPVTINGGYVMPAWYDIVEMEIDRKVDTTQLLMSAEVIRAFIDQERQRGIDSERILVAGFSQGGAVAYQTALTYPEPLGGLLAMSTYLATAASIGLHPANRTLPIEVHHGTFDPVVPVKLGKEAVRHLRAKGYMVEYREYAMEHGVCAEQIADISRWLQERLQ